jgi:hypothetical protein
VKNALRFISGSFLASVFAGVLVGLRYQSVSSGMLAMFIVACCTFPFQAYLIITQNLFGEDNEPVKLNLPPDELKALVEALNESKQILHIKAVPLLRCGDNPQLASAMVKIERGFAEIDAALWVRRGVVNIGTIIQQPVIPTKKEQNKQ